MVEPISFVWSQLGGSRQGPQEHQEKPERVGECEIFSNWEVGVVEGPIADSRVKGCE